MIATPLNPRYFQILLALSKEALHGYGIQRAVLEQTDEGMHLWPATLYRSLAALEEGGLIEQSETPVGEPEDERRQYYVLTSEGRRRLKTEAELMARWVAEARAGGS
ncbi:MAG: helix-turn-helix transcriptional regulator [Longimicrobiales bacterium]|nr:helix-turn-helix transcriptional regulator [Longimicrobiales bacterium]